MNNRSYTYELHNLIASLPIDEREKFMQMFLNRQKNPTIAWGLDAFLGNLGFDRFYVGDTLLGVIKLITLGGCGIWTIIDLFLIAGRAREKNMMMAREIKSIITPVALAAPTLRGPDLIIEREAEHPTARSYVKHN